MNFMSKKKLYFARNNAKSKYSHTPTISFAQTYSECVELAEKLKQSKLDGFLKSPAPSRAVKANRSAMLQEFFMGAVAPARRVSTNRTEANAPAETSISSVDNSNGLLESRVVMGESFYF